MSRPLTRGDLLGQNSVRVWSVGSSSEGAMRTAAEYRKHAEECQAMAKRAKTAEEREMISNMAATWRTLADQRERLLEKRAEEKQQKQEA